MSDGSLQAHHLICSKAVNKDAWEKIFNNLDYKIHNKNNGIMLPSIMALACYLKLPLHRGNHDATYPRYPRYPRYVKPLLADVRGKIKSSVFCGKGSNKKFAKEMDVISENILMKVKRFNVTLTADGRDYMEKSPKGRGSLIAIGDKPLNCQSSRKHSFKHELPQLELLVSESDELMIADNNFKKNIIMKYYIPVEVTKNNSPILDIEDEEIEHSMWMGEFVNDANHDVEISGDIGSESEPYLPDFMEAPYPVISNRLAKIINGFKLDRVQLIPVKILIKERKYGGYYLLNSNHLVNAIDDRKSQITRGATGSILDVSKLVLNHDEINKHDSHVNEIFRMTQKTTIFIFSENIIEEFNKLPGLEMSFIEAEKWYTTIAFDL